MENIHQGMLFCRGGSYPQQRPGCEIPRVVQDTVQAGRAGGGNVLSDPMVLGFKAANRLN